MNALAAVAGAAVIVLGALALVGVVIFMTCNPEDINGTPEDKTGEEK